MQQSKACALAAAAVLSIAGISFADTTYVASEDSALFGLSSQNATDNGMSNGTYLITPTSGQPGAQKAPVACAPTATVNSFQFLQNLYGDMGLVGSNPYDAINSLASATYMNTQDAMLNNNPPPTYVGGGTSASNMVLGKEQYIQDHFTSPGAGITGIQTVGQSVFFSQASNGNNLGGIQQTTPTAAFIQQQLDEGEDIEAWETWTDANGNPTGGAHIITITGINYNQTTNSGSLSFIDPYGGNGTNDAVDVTSNTLESIGGSLVLGYTGGGAGNDGDPDNNGNTGYARLDMVLAESPVPEPATATLVLMGIAAIAMCRTRRTA